MKATESSPPSLEAGTAGGSAQREYERRHANRERRIRADHPKVGGLILALSEDPQSTSAWSRGAEGERRVGARLDALAAEGMVVLHDRRIPGTRANIDHVVIAPSGVWVIDAKRYAGKVEKRDVGGFFRRDERLFVGTRDCSKLLDGVVRQVETVRAAVGDREQPPVVAPVLCFVDAEWGLFTNPFRINEVLVTWPNALLREVRAAAPLVQACDLQGIATRVTTGFPSA